MGWTYDVDVVIFVALDDVKHWEDEKDIRNYVSVYRTEYLPRLGEVF